MKKFLGHDHILYSRYSFEKYFITSLFMLQKLDNTKEGCQTIVLTLLDEKAKQVLLY